MRKAALSITLLACASGAYGRGSDTPSAPPPLYRKKPPEPAIDPTTAVIPPTVTPSVSTPFVPSEHESAKPTFPASDVKPPLPSDTTTKPFTTEQTVTDHVPPPEPITDTTPPPPLLTVAPPSSPLPTKPAKHVVATKAPPAIAAPKVIYALRIGDAILWEFVLQKNKTGWATQWLRPTLFDFDGASFEHIEGTPLAREGSVVSLGEDQLQLSFPDPKPGAVPDIFYLKNVGTSAVTLEYIGTGFEPFNMVRLPRPAPLHWGAGKAYSLARTRTTNAALTALYTADIADRAQGEKADWATIASNDKARRAQVQALLNTDALSSGEDYMHAAYIFQHGDNAEDHLKAHLLATVAIARGTSAATLIAAASLDRYLLESGRSQIFGTQHDMNGGVRRVATPYDKSFVPDALRAAMHVPPGD